MNTKTQKDGLNMNTACSASLGMYQSMWAERGAERAKYSRSAERVFIQRPERSLCLAPVPLRYRSHHESRACTNPPRIHLCLQQLTKLSAYTSKIVRCEGEMEFVVLIGLLVLSKVPTSIPFGTEILKTSISHFKTRHFAKDRCLVYFWRTPRPNRTANTK